MHYSFRQGDVIITPRTSPIIGSVQSHLTLAEGELTGHAHRISNGNAVLYRDAVGVMSLEVRSISTLTHEEHAQVTLPVGLYDINIQREYSPEGWTNVAD